VAQPAVDSTPDPRVDHDHIVLVRNATWADYQRMLEIRGDHPVPRIAYHQGVLELMTPSRSHEVRKSLIGCLVEAWCMEKGIEITPYGSWTLESKEADRGAEPDECYVVGDVPEPKRPDLAIEVVWTSGGLDKLAIYERLGVREVWTWKQGRFSLHALRARGYEPIAAGEVLPGIDLEQLEGFVTLQPMTRAVREYRAALSASRKP
jgi:Uma2 family endonuclease